MTDVRLVDRVEAGRSWPVLLWLPGPGWRMVSTAVVGGGIGARAWWLNAKVPMDYADPDPAGHVRRIAAAVGVGTSDGPGDGNGDGESAGVGRSGEAGVGMLTAADVTRWTCADDGGVVAVATVGLGLPVWAAASDAIAAREAGTINLLVRLPVPLSDAALVNAVVTATEAKTQALVEAGVPGSGTSSDAVCIACPIPIPIPIPIPTSTPTPPLTPASDAAANGQPIEQYGGPRSPWGLRLARAVHAAVTAGTVDWVERHPDGDPHRRWPPSGPGM